MADVPELKTRKPTGKPPWPLVVLAGVEKSGKSWAGAEFSASDLIDRTFWCEIGEGAADQYGILPGARYEILEHDGSYVGIGRALRAATMAPRPAGKPHAIVVDAVSALWDMLSDEAQAAANAREKRKHPDRPLTGDVQITMDLWNIAKARWNRIINMLRVYDGPVILMARLETVAVVEKGKPTETKALKIKGEKNLPYEADAIVRIPAPREYEITGVRSVFWQMEPGGSMPAPEFTLDWLMRKLGLAAEGATAPRSYTAPAPDGADFEREVDRPMERSRPRQPEEDPWATAAPAPTTPSPAAGAPTPEQPAAPQAETGERQKPNQRILATVNAEIKKRLGGGGSDADRFALIGRIIGHQITTTNDLSFDEAKLILVTLANEQLFTDLQVAIAGAADPSVLGNVYQQVKDAFGSGRLTQEQFAELDRLGAAAAADFTAAQREPAGVS